MPTRNIDLTEHYDSFVQEQIASGRYKDASDVMRAGLRLLESQSTEEMERLQVLRSLSAEGFASIDQGRGIGLHSKTQLRGRIASIGKQAAKRANRRTT